MMTNHVAEAKGQINVNKGNSFDALVLHYRSPMVGYMERRLRNRNQAEDVVQEAFLRLYRQLQGKTAPDHIPAWLFKVAENLCRDYWRSAAYNREMAIKGNGSEQQDDSNQPEEVFEQWESRTEMDRLLLELPESQRQMVILRFYKDLKLSEIAEQLDCPLGTVKSRLFHALRFLKNQIEEKGRD